MSKAPRRESPRRAAATLTVELWLACALLALAAFAARDMLGLGETYPWKVLAGAALAAAVAASAVPRGAWPARLGAANRVTLARAMLAALLLGTLGEPASAGGWWVAGAAGIAVVLDGLDGWLARRTGNQSAFGARFDMETDAALIAVLSLLVLDLERAGAWVLLAGLLRYLFVAAGRAWRWLGKPLPASRRRQSACVIQTVALLLCLTPALAPPASSVVAALGVAVLGASFALDVSWLAGQRSGQARGAEA